MSLNTFLCKRYKKDTVTVKDILLDTLLIVFPVTLIGILYINGAWFYYSQPMQMSVFDAVSVLVCATATWAVILAGLGVISIPIMFKIGEIKIISCKRGNQK